MTAPTMDEKTYDDPGYQSPEYHALKKRWQFVRDIRNINETIRSKPRTVLPQAEIEGPDKYQARVNLTVGFNALDETIHGLVGLATRHDPVLGDDVPPQLRQFWEDIDLQGNHGAVFAQQLLDHAIQDGHCGVLIDYPPADPDRSLEQEISQGLRPYAVLVPIDRITAWRVGRVLGRLCLTMLKIEENGSAAAGKFGVKTVARQRVFYQSVESVDGDEKPVVQYEVYEKGADDKWFRESAGVLRGPRWIPFRVAYGGNRRGVLDSLPSLYGLAWTNLAHTQTTSQHAWSLYKTGIAIPVARGRSNPDQPLVLSSDRVIDVSADGGFEFAEGAAVGLEPAANTLATLERRMGSQGFSMLRREVQTQQTATEKEMQARREESKLARAVRSVNDALEGVLADMAAYLALPEGAGGRIDMNRNFSDISLEPEEMRLLIELELAGKLTHATLLRQLKAGGRVLQGVDIEEEIANVTTQDRLDPDPDLDPERVKDLIARLTAAEDK